VEEASVLSLHATPCVEWEDFFLAGSFGDETPGALHPASFWHHTNQATPNISWKASTIDQYELAVSGTSVISAQRKMVCFDQSANSRRSKLIFGTLIQTSANE
jgi:hypothetical protein